MIANEKKEEIQKKFAKTDADNNTSIMNVINYN